MNQIHKNRKNPQIDYNNEKVDVLKMPSAYKY